MPGAISATNLEMGCAGSRRHSKRASPNLSEQLLERASVGDQGCEKSDGSTDLPAESADELGKPDETLPGRENENVAELMNNKATILAADELDDHRIEKVYDHVDEKGTRTSVLRSAYAREKKMSENDTMNWVRSELFEILQRELMRPVSSEKALQMVQNHSLSASVTNDTLLLAALSLIRSSDFANMHEFTSKLKELVDDSQEYGERDYANCLQVLSQFAEEKASIKSLLKVMHDKLEQNQTLLDVDICRNSGKKTSPFADMQMNASEHENVEVIVKKLVRERPVTWDELRHRNIRPEHLAGKREMYIVSETPKGIDDDVRAKAEEMMIAAGTIYTADAAYEPGTAVNEAKNRAGEADVGVKYIAKIMEDHQNFALKVQHDLKSFSFETTTPNDYA